jgi:branched-chain amino acid aminotransferase
MAFLFYFQSMNSICLNGKMVPGDEPVLKVDNRSFRYGDGIFETMKVVNKKILLETLHFERFFSSLALMGFNIPPLITPGKMREQVLALCQKNKCDSLARVRMSVFRGNGGIFESLDDFQYCIECWPLNVSIRQLNENGLVIDIFPDARKSCDKFSNLKSANYLPYAMAARYAKENKLNECLILNVHDRIADATIANIFLVKDGKLITPPLSEGCVNGVMRRYIIENVRAEESEIAKRDLQEADEIFLSNAISGIRWVKSFRQKSYSNLQSIKIYKDLIQTISA